ncbi:MAG: serine/threonine-protein kinase [Pseudomonadota bacterium]
MTNNMTDDEGTAAAAIALERQALALFMDWLQQELPDLDAFLAARDARDPALIERVRAFVETDAQTREDFDEVALPSVPLLREPPAQLGAYRLGELVGQGGMGRVYLGERADGAFERQVAIKLIGFGAFTARARERFAAECQIMAQLRHRNIVTVLDGGAENGLPYLVMEYVPGEPFGHDPARRPRDTLRCFEKVCSAVSYAHGRLVLHRDIKAGNVLIDEDGEPKLLDFGVAKLLEHIHGQEANLTATGQAPTTLSHSAPEILRGEAASVQSDVYALGVLLWQALTGALPYGDVPTSAVAALKQIEGGAPVAPTGMAEDLYRILRQALHPDLTRRYSSAAALADDVHSYLQNRPIAARRDNAAYVLRKFIRRNRLATLSVLALVAVLAGSLIAVLGALGDARTQRTLALAQADNAEAANAFITNVLQSANPQSWQFHRTVDELLDEARRQVRIEGSELAPGARITVLINLALVSAGRNQSDDAEEYVAQAESLLNAQTASSVTAGQWTLLAAALAQLQRNERAEAAARRALAYYEAYPNEALDGALLNVYGTLGEVLSAQGRFEEAIELFTSSLATLQDEGDEVSSNGALFHYSLANAYFTLSRVDEAIEHVDRAAEIMGELDLLATSDGLQVQSAQLIALDTTGDHEAVDQLYQDIMARQRDYLSDTHPRMVTMAANQARRLHVRGRAADAVALLAPLEDHVRTQVPLENAGVNYFMAKLGYARCDAGEPQRGKGDLEYALESARVAYGQDNWYVADIIGAIGYCEIALGAFDEAEQNLTRSYELFRDLWGESHYATQGKLKWLALLEERRAAGSS